MESSIQKLFTAKTLKPFHRQDAKAAKKTKQKLKTEQVLVFALLGALGVLAVNALVLAVNALVLAVKAL